MAIFLIINSMQFSPLYLFTCDTLSDCITGIVLIPEPSAMESATGCYPITFSPDYEGLIFHLHVSMNL